MTLHEYITARFGEPFCYGRMDCVLFAADWIKQATGKDVIAGLHLQAIRQCSSIVFMYTVIETPLCQRYADSIWNEDERLEFISWLSDNPLAGDVVPGTGGVRKVRWSAAGKGKRGGVRGIYYNVLENGEIYLLIVYAKAEYDNISSKTLARMREEMQNG